MDSTSDEVLLDRRHADVFLSLAVREGLLFEFQDSDGLLGHLPNVTIEQRNALFEQIIMCPGLVLDSTADYYLAGDALDRGIVRFVPRDAGTPDDEEIPVDHLAPAMLNMGVARTIEELIAFAESADRELDNLQAQFDVLGLGPVNLLTVTVRNALERGGSGSRLSALQDATRDFFDRTRALREGFDHYVRTRALLDQLGLVNVYADGFLGAADTVISPGPTTVPREAVIRLAVDDLCLVPHRQTLRETIEISRTPACADLRNHLDEMRRHVMDGDLGAVERLRRAAARSAQALGIADDLGRGAAVITYLGAAEALAAEVVHLGLPPELGVAVAVVGGCAQLGAGMTKRAVRWASVRSLP